MTDEIPGGFDGFYGDIIVPFPWSETDVVVVEGFTVNASTHRKDPTAFRDTNDLIGALRVISRIHGITYVVQSPSQAKSFGSNDKLKRLGWYVGTKGGHRNDAARHLITYLATNERDPHILGVLLDRD
jgi:hypothetical protein